MLVRVKVFSGAKKTKTVKINDGRFEVHVKAKPIRGLANREVVEVLAEHFKVPLENIRLLRGFKRRNKLFDVLL